MEKYRDIHSTESFRNRFKNSYKNNCINDFCYIIDDISEYICELKEEQDFIKENSTWDNQITEERDSIDLRIAQAVELINRAEEYLDRDYPNIRRYYIFDSVNEKIQYYNSLEELLNNAKNYIDIIVKGKYISVGAEYLRNNISVGANDFICKMPGSNKFDYSECIEKSKIQVPYEFNKVLEKLIEIL